MAGLALVALFAVRNADALVDRASWGLWVLFAAVVIGELLPIRLGPDRGEVAPSTTFTFAVLLHTGLAAAVLAQATASVLADILDRKRPSRSAFNVAQYSLSLSAAGAVAAPDRGPPPPRHAAPGRRPGHPARRRRSSSSSTPAWWPPPSRS